MSDECLTYSLYCIAINMTLRQFLLYHLSNY